MTLSASLTLFLSMAILALIPGPGVLVVVSRTLSLGLRQGFITAAGIVAGDYVFILLALFGLAALAEVMGGLFIIVKYLGAAFLIWLGVSLVLSRRQKLSPAEVKSSGGLSSFVVGLFTTLSNPKAILFYASFFPAFLDLSTVALQDVCMIFMVTTLAVGGVMCAYAYFSHKAKSTIHNAQRSSALTYGSGALLVGSGLFVAARG